MTENSKTDTKVIFALILVHFTGDFYASFINPLLPVFVEKFALSMTQVGLIAGISRLLSLLIQPTAGYIADHHRTRIFILGGPLLSMIFIPLVGVAQSFLILILFISLGSIGQSMFHPTAAGMISTYSGANFGFSMSLFNMGGTFAFGIGPLFIAYFVRYYGLAASPLTIAIGLPLMVLLFRLVPLPESEGLRNLGFIGSIRESMGTVWKSILIIWVVMVLRSFTSQSFMVFVPVLFSEEGYSLVSIGAIISIFTVAGSISGLVAGYLSDKIGYKPIFFTAHLLTTPSLYLLLFLRDHWIYLSAFLGGFCAMATLPLGVALAQELVSKGKSMVSSLMMGLALGTGGMMSPLAGKLADIFSIKEVLAFMTLIPLLTIPLILMLPERKRKNYQVKI